MSFITELKRRNVFKVGITYLITSWLLIQVVDILLDNIGAPAWVLQTLFVALGVGFVITLFAAWAFELTPEGVKREKDVDRSQSITPTTGKKLNKAIFALMAVALIYFIWESRFQDEGIIPAESGTPTAAAENKVSAEESLADLQEPAVDPKSIAVLPFDNRSRLEDDEFFVEGVHDDLLTSLARIGSLKVISRTSVGKYKNTEKTIPEIAGELGVATVMEGAVQRAGNTVRINVQLIDAKTDEHLWAEIFDRELTTNNLFAIQTEISEKIAAALKAALSDEEQQQINRRPTENMGAYQAYVRGRQSMAKRTSASLEQAMAEYRRAVDLDPGFALAWVGIAECSRLLAVYGTLSPNENMSIMEEAVDQALELDPTLGEAYVSLAVIYDMQNQFDKSEEAYLRAIQLNPNYSTAYHWYSDSLRFQRNRIGEALATSPKALELDPLSSIIRVDLGGRRINKNDLDRAETLFLETLDLEPNFPPAYSGLAYVARERGRLDEFFRWNQQSLRLDPGSMALLMDQYMVLIQLGLNEQAQEFFTRMEEVDDQHFMLSIARAETNVMRGQKTAAIEHANYLVQSVNQPWPLWMAGVIYATNGDYQKARELMLSPGRPYDDVDEWPKLLTDFGDDACDIAWVLMKTGDEELARNLLIYTVAYLEEELPKYIEHGDRHGVTACHAALGDKEATLASLEDYVEHGHLEGWAYLRMWPPFEFLLDNARFIELDSRVNQSIAAQAAVVEKMLMDETS
jgi:TolB-like protein/Tfp pilus assembly protein PilF